MVDVQGSMPPPPQTSPDGKYFWNGQAWVPTPAANAEASAGGTSGKAVAALVLGILWIWGVGSLLAIIFGISARRDIRKRQTLGGSGMATAGIVLGLVGLVGAVILTVAAVSVGNSVNSENHALAADGTSLDVNGTLTEASLAELSYSLTSGKYTTSTAALETEDFSPDAGVTFSVLRATKTTYCLSASDGTTHLYQSSSEATPTTTSCV